MKGQKNYGDFLNTACIESTKNPILQISYMDITPQDPNNTKFGDGEIEEIKMGIFNKVINLSAINISSSYSTSLENDIKKLHGIDIEDTIKNRILNESDTAKNLHLAKLYAQLAKISKDEFIYSSKWKRFIKKVFKKIEFPEYIGDNYSSEAVRTLIKKIIVHSNLLALRSRIGSADFIIVGSEIGSMIQDSKELVYKDTSKELNQNGIRMIGYIAGRIKVFIDPYMEFDDKSIILGKETKKNHPGVYFVYNEEIGGFTEPAYTNNLDKKIMLIERYSIVDVGDSAHRNFISFNVEFSKKPLWRKILCL